MFALVDCNSFFASCEQVFRPDLRGKPLIVLSNNDGCIVARSKEAKSLGIPDLEPYFKLKEQLKRNHVHVFSSNYELYGDLSSRVMRTLEQFSPDIEIYSIDEAFLSLSGISGDIREYGQLIRKAVQQQVGLAVGIGIAPTKTLAKLASYIAKRSIRCEYVCLIKNNREWKKEWQKVFSKIPIIKIWGVGNKLSKRLNDQHIYSVWDLMQQDSQQMRKRYSINIARTIDELNGIPCYTLEQQPQPKKQIYSTRSFSSKITHSAALEQSISLYANRACVKLRNQNQLVKTILVFASSGHFVDKPYSRSITIPLAMPSNDTRIISSLAKQAIRDFIFKEGVPFARAGVGLIELQAERPEQLDVFTATQSNKSKQLMKVIDEINKRHAPVYFASQGINPHWVMQRNLKSPSYTTSWKDLPCVQVK